MRAAAVTTTLLLAAACGGPRERGAPPPAPVVVAVAESRAVPVEIPALGTVQPVSAVQVRPRVAGALRAVHFREGDHVESGQLLFALDDRPFRAALQAARAELAAAKARAERAEAEAKRFDQLGGGKLASPSEVEAARTGSTAAAAAVLAAEAAVSRAALDLSYARIESPLTGRAGELAAHPGDAVKANETVLVTVRQIAPVQVAFPVPAAQLAGIRARQAEQALPVQAQEPGAGRVVAEGTLAFIDSAVDPGSGTVKLKATFENRDEALWPGDFVNVVLRLGVEDGAVVVPAGAVQRGQQGEYAFVVTADGTAEMRTIGVARRSGDMAVIREGIAAGERVIVDGHLRVAPGGKVAPRERPAPAKVTENSGPEAP